MATKLEWLRKPILIACLLFAADQGVAQTIWVDDDKNNLYTIDLGNNNSIKPIVTISGLGNMVERSSPGQTRHGCVALRTLCYLGHLHVQRRRNGS